MTLPFEVLRTIITEPGFSEVLEECLRTDELVENFERIFQVKRPPNRLTPIEIMVDEATGFRQSQWNDFFAAFIPFVHRVVWSPLRSEGKV
jgi:hypothetical protein